MAVKPNMQYEDLVSDFMRKYFSHCKMNKSGKMVISEMMQGIHDSLMKNFESEYGISGDISDNVVLKCVQKAVMKTFPSGIRQHAIAEGNRQLSLYRSGLLDYDPIESLKALKSETEVTAKNKNKKAVGDSGAKQPASVFGEFSSAARKMPSNMNPEFTLANDAKQFIGFHLLKLASKVAAGAVSNAGANPRLVTKDIMNVLPQFLTPDLLENSYSEGNRCLLLHVQGLQVFKPKKTTGTKQPLLLTDEDFLDRKKNNSDEPQASTISSVIFRPGVKRMLAEKTNASELPRINDGSRRLTEVLFSVADYITDKVAEHSSTRNLIEIDFCHVGEVLEEIFPPNIFQDAVYNGYSNVEDFVKGILKYKKRSPVVRKLSPQKKRKIETPKTSPRKRTKGSPKSKALLKGTKRDPSKLTHSEKPKPKELKFQNGVLELIQESFRDNSVCIGLEGTEKINSFLTGICSSLVAQFAGDQTPLTASDVRAKVEEYFPREMASNAIAAAEGLLMTHAPQQSVGSSQTKSLPPRAAAEYSADSRFQKSAEADPYSAMRDIKDILLQHEQENKTKTSKSKKGPEKLLHDIKKILKLTELNLNAPSSQVREEEIKREAESDAVSNETIDTESEYGSYIVNDSEIAEDSAAEEGGTSNENMADGEEYTPSEEPTSQNEE